MSTGGYDFALPPTAAPPSLDPQQRPHDPVAAQIRNDVAGRMQEMNSRHALNAWELRRKNPIGPHALAFLYAEPDGRELQAGLERYAVKAATRLFLDGDDVRDLATLLHRMVAIAADRLTAGLDFDPRKAMTNRADPMSSRASYIGVAWSTLDSAAGTWEDMQRTVDGPLAVPGEAYVLLKDKTRMIIDRQPGPLGVRLRSTRSLDVVLGNPMTAWRWMKEETPEQGSAEWWLEELHRTVAEGQRQQQNPGRAKRRT
jgi:hypothetical protein